MRWEWMPRGGGGVNLSFKNESRDVGILYF